MPSVVLEGEVQEKDQYGVWRTVRLGPFVVKDHRQFTHEAREQMADWIARETFRRAHGFDIPKPGDRIIYVPGTAGAFRPFSSGMMQA